MSMIRVDHNFWLASMRNQENLRNRLAGTPYIQHIFGWLTLNFFSVPYEPNRKTEKATAQLIG